MSDGQAIIHHAPSAYGLRIALISLSLAVATILVVVLAPRSVDVTVVANEPNGGGVSPDTPVRVTFSRPIDQQSAERAFVLYPPARGHFTWRDKQTLQFIPSDSLRSQTLYSVTIRPGLRDSRGRANLAETHWSFRTR
jgi:hypothetical protein